MALICSLRKLAAYLVVGSASACSTFVTYQGQALPDEELATFHCYSRFYLVYMESCAVQAVDGVRPGLGALFGNTSKILPGTHWIEIAFESHFGGGGGVTDVCAFDIDLKPGATYQVKAHSLSTDVSLLGKHGHRGFYAGSMNIEIKDRASHSELRTIAASCSAFGGSMCRKDEDCVHHPNLRCFPQEGFTFGACGFKREEQ